MGDTDRENLILSEELMIAACSRGGGVPVGEPDA
jgi:hypothetical protein